MNKETNITIFASDTGRQEESVMEIHFHFHIFTVTASTQLQCNEDSARRAQHHARSKLLSEGIAERHPGMYSMQNAQPDEPIVTAYYTTKNT